jgi:hypothetical protein
VLCRRFGPLDDLPVRVVVRHGEAATDTCAALTDLGGWGQAVLGIFDSWGNVAVPLSVMERIARNPASEVIVTFGPNWFSRREDLEPERLDAVFGDRQRWQPAEAETRPDERWRIWLETYRDALHTAGFTYRLQFEVVPKTGQPLHLVYGTGHTSGVEVMKDAMWHVDGHDGMSFRDPRTHGAIPLGQMAIWDAAEESSELRELLTLRLHQGPATLHELGQWLLVETARWRAKDARTAVQHLLAAGAATAEPGRLTNATRVTLRT